MAYQRHFQVQKFTKQKNIGEEKKKKKKKTSTQKQP